MPSAADPQHRQKQPLSLLSLSKPRIGMPPPATSAAAQFYAIPAARRSAPDLSSPNSPSSPRFFVGGDDFSELSSSFQHHFSRDRNSHPAFSPGSFSSVKPNLPRAHSSASTSSSSNPAEARDVYGFRKQSQYISAADYDEWFAGYEKYMRHRRRRWETYLRDLKIEIGDDGVPLAFPPKSKKTKRYIRKGIPIDWRGAAWFWYAKGPEYLKKNPGLYERLWTRGLGSPPVDSELIERDLHRTFPDNIHYRDADSQQQPTTSTGSPATTPGSTKSGSSNSRRNSSVPETPIVQSLRRVLYAFSLYVPKTGYCQSLNFVAGLLLLLMEEEKAFWMLVIMTQRYLPGVHEINLEGANIDQGVLMMCVKESLPIVWNKIGAGLEGYMHDDMIVRLPPITLCTAAWFMSGFIGVLPIESVARVWDCFFYEDSKIFFRIALTILKLSEPQIESVRDPMEIFQVVQTIPRQLLDASSLIQSCFRRHNGFGHISQDEIAQRRIYVAEKRRKLGAHSPSIFSELDQPALPPSSISSASRRYGSITSLAAAGAVSRDANGKKKYGKRVQMARMGSTNIITTNMLSLNARNDYFGPPSLSRSSSGTSTPVI